MENKIIFTKWMERAIFIVCALPVFLFVAPSANAQSEWRKFQTTPDNNIELDVKFGSMRAETTKEGTTINALTVRVLNKITNTINLEKWYVSSKDCKGKAGELVTAHINGKFMSETDFVFGGGNVASYMAEVICNAADKSAAQ
ncbi:hypothetical protein [Halothiobacillus sp.]|uniref:hypothetical protein n=1 Tax=Halothiobacillus sp. TaxID=1891311 RepID=UPI002AD4396A|nr:hypothetical protein [Halothiobacillus sp.]